MNSSRSEDQQPNELRRNRRGSSLTVPVIRATHTTARPSRGSRGRPHVGRNFYPLGNTRVGLQVGGGPPPPPGHDPSPSSRPAGENHPGARHQFKRDAPDAPATRGDGRPHKQPRLSCHDLPRRPRASSPGPSTRRNSQNYDGKNNSGSPSRFYVDVELPLFCRKGAPDCKRMRHQWIQAEQERVEQEHHATVLNHDIIDSVHVRFRCLRLRKPTMLHGPTEEPSQPSNTLLGPSAPRLHLEPDPVKHEEVDVPVTAIKREQDEDKLHWSPPPASMDADVAHILDDTSRQTSGQHVEARTLAFIQLSC